MAALKRFPFQTGPVSFLGTPLAGWTEDGAPEPLDRKLAFLGLPYDAATTYRSGARMGPRAIRNASIMLTDGAHPLFGTDPAQVIEDWGDAAIPHVGHAAALDCVRDAVRGLVGRQRHPLLAGGDHSVTLGALRALRSFHDRPLGCIHFDAHCDTWVDHFGDPTGHGTWTRNAIEEGLIEAYRTVQIGIRSPVDQATRRWLPARGGVVLSARWANALPPKEMAAVLWEMFAPQSAGLVPVYLTFDIDALDPAHAPGTGTPEVGGLSMIWVLDVIERLRGLNFVGMDVVEVLPAHDTSEITALAAATLLWTYAAMSAAARPTTDET